jgi:hypothetical protein
MPDDPMRDLVRRLFPKPPATETPAAEEPAGSPSPHEGANPPRHDDPMRDFIRDLFTPID